MTKDEIKDMLESYKFEQQFYIEKRKELDNIKEYYLKTIKILKEFNKEHQNQLVEDVILSYVKDLIEHENKLAGLHEHLRQIEGFLDHVSQPYKTVLYYKYIQGLSVEEIANTMNYSPQRIYQLHDLGIEQLSKKEDVI